MLLTQRDVERFIRWYRVRILTTLFFVLLDAVCIAFLLVTGLAWRSPIAAATVVFAVIMIWIGAGLIVRGNRTIRQVRQILRG
jgi:hypothetical protein